MINLVLDDGVPDVFRKFVHGASVCLVLLVATCAGALRYGPQLVLNPLESPEVELTRALIHNGQMIPTQTGSFVAWIPLCR